ncbi:YHS domain-containing (seleno)protein [Paracraurococcus ruber]|uniref:YHS domain protein n=1 Tax=Paracraurococcus ruber TaxID=77675 RepID=A0ABS1D2L8_9PROT|nr:YHS domain-containing (seleno)protein [Paracraurococcus ruber]MBK1660913.1 YHS domain protein [Paracraurococcus ruber]TDG29398.1 YHS domain-containing protein [Paracraurococcus ruber]
MTRPSRRRLLGLLLLPSATCAQPPAPAQTYAENGLAIRGTDPVAYFTEGRPVPGRAEFRHDWRGATWLFASAANRDAFAAAPDRYAPAYGGFCAYAVSEGYTAPTDPAAWRIVDGRLFLNYDRSVQRTWEGDIPGRVRRGDANWQRLRPAGG